MGPKVHLDRPAGGGRAAKPHSPGFPVPPEGLAAHDSVSEDPCSADLPRAANQGRKRPLEKGRDGIPPLISPRASR